MEIKLATELLRLGYPISELKARIKMPAALRLVNVAPATSVLVSGRSFNGEDEMRRNGVAFNTKRGCHG